MQRGIKMTRELDLLQSVAAAAAVVAWEDSSNSPI